MEKLAAAERKFSETMPPVEALRAWMLLFVDHIAAKQIIAPALNRWSEAHQSCMRVLAVMIQGAIDALVKRAIKSGDIRRDLEPFDLLRALIGVCPCRVRPWLAAKRPEAGGHPHHRLTPSQVDRVSRTRIDGFEAIENSNSA